MNSNGQRINRGGAAEEVRIPGNNTPKLQTGALVELLTRSFVRHIQQDRIEKHPSVFIQGQPGIGKSQAVREIARNLESITHIATHVIDVRLLLFSPMDLRGIPVADMTQRVAIWLKPILFQLEDSKEVVYLLFLDELTAAPLSIQTAAYQIALDRKLGEHHLPNNTFVIAAGNRSSDASVVYEMPSALKNRFMHFELEISLDAWMTWATQEGIHEDLIRYLKAHPERFVSEKMKDGDNILVTPRSWELLSNLLWAMDGVKEKNIGLIASLVGNEIAHEMIGNLPSINLDNVLSGKGESEPLDLSSIQGFVEQAGKRLDDILTDVVKTTNLLRFMERLPFDYAVILFQKMIRVRELPYQLSSLPEYQSMVSRLEALDVR